MREATSSSRSFRYLSVVSLFLCVAIVVLAKDTTRDVARVKKDYGKLPLSFEANQGQTDPSVKFFSRGANSSVFLTADGAVVSVAETEAGDPARLGRPVTPDSVKNSVLRLKLVGSNHATSVTGEAMLPGKTNYLLGNDRKEWRTGISNYGRVKYSDVYRGVDLVFYGNQSGLLEHDFIVKPGGEPKNIALQLEGADSLSIGANGDLRAGVGGKLFVLQKPLVYQEIDGVKREVAGRYRLSRHSRVRFEVSEYDRSKPLIIDPVLVYSTYLSSTINQGVGIAADASGSAYIVGSTNATNFPTTSGSFQTSCPDLSSTYCYSGYVTKLTPDGSSLLYSTYIGGTSQGYVTVADAIAVDSSGNAYLTGYTSDPGFPVTANAYQSECPTLQPTTPPTCYGSNAFVTELNATGSNLIYSTYLGGSIGQYGTTGTGIAVDNSGNIYASGNTVSQNFPTVNAFQTALGDLNGLCSAGSYAVGDLYLSKFGLQSGNMTLLYSTYIGGSGQETPTYWDTSNSLAVDNSGNAYVTGNTSSVDFPVTTNGYQQSCGTDGMCNGLSCRQSGADAIITKIDTTQTGAASLAYSSYLGGSSGEQGVGIAVDNSGHAYLTGWTFSTDFPTTAGAVSTCVIGQSIDSYVTKLDTTQSGAASLIYSTCPGDASGSITSGIAIDSSGSAYVQGIVNDINQPYPLVNPIDSVGDTFVTKFSPDGMSLVWSTIVGDGGNVYANSITLDPSANVYVTAGSTSPDYPITSGSYSDICDPNKGCNNASGLPMIVSKISQGDGSMATLGPWALTFASQTQGSSSPVQTITVHDMGDQPFSINGISFGGTNPGDFSETDNCGTPSFPFVLGAASQCVISVTFTPQGVGTRSGTLSISDTASGSPHVASLSGTGTSGTPPLEFLPASIGFGNQALGTTSTSHTLTIKNTSTAPVTQIAVGITGADPGDFALTTSCGSALAAGASCKSTIKFTPSVLAAETASVSVTDSSFSIAQTSALTGNGVVPAALTPATLAFGSVGLDSPSTSKIATLTNNNSFVVDISNIAISGPNSADFAQSTTTCGATLAAKGHCTITLVFTPSVSGPETASLVTTDAATDSPQTISLTGTGVAPVTVTPASLIFAHQNAGTTSAAKTITVKNDQNIPLTGIHLAGPGNSDFRVVTTTCSSMLAAGKTCTISLNFSPASGGPQSGGLEILDTASTSPQVVPLSGTGVISVTVTPATLTFASQTVGTTSASKTITVKNNNTIEPLPNISISLTGSDTGDFNPTNNCTSSLAPSSSCTITVTFEPTATGSRTAKLTISDINGTTDQQIVSLSGTGK
jgi:Abnormal spindle-like microcephaly-assoc'd, ASPM-SPD-2-Hydin/Beta-propeller repeat